MLNEQADKDIAESLVNAMFEGINELIAIDVLGIAVYSEDGHNLKCSFSLSDEGNEDMRELMTRCFETQTVYWTEKIALNAFLCGWKPEEKIVAPVYWL